MTNIFCEYHTQTTLCHAQKIWSHFLCVLVMFPHQLYLVHLGKFNCSQIVPDISKYIQILPFRKILFPLKISGGWRENMTGVRNLTSNQGWNKGGRERSFAFPQGITKQCKKKEIEIIPVENTGFGIYGNSRKYLPGNISRQFP